MEITSAEFVISNTDVKKCPTGVFPEYAFIGRSNVGKSSLINMLTARKGLAMTSATPGKTMLINHFLINQSWYLVDLPGYGYAKVSKAERERWGKLMEQFFAVDGLIDLGVMIVDSRHKPTADDVTMAEWFKSTGCPLVVVANKADKLKKSEIEPNLELIRLTLGLDDSTPLILFSAEKGSGREALMSQILNYV